jgi:hypothetical protein
MRPSLKDLFKAWINKEFLLARVMHIKTYHVCYLRRCFIEEYAKLSI